MRWVGLGLGLLVLACDSRSPRAIDDPDGMTTESSGSGGTDGDASMGGSGASGGGGTTHTVGAGGSLGEAGSGSSDATGSGGSAGGSGAGPVDTTPTPCNASDGSGCGEDEFCLDTRSDSCVAGFDADCQGLCATTLSAASCDDGPAQCGGTVTCKAARPECATGLVNSVIDQCWGPCVPADCCSCGENVACPNSNVACDLASGRCVVPAAPEPRCSLPFDPVSCSGPAQFAFIDGRCQEAPDGACGGNDNRFETIEECLRRCEGLPQQRACPEGRIAADICLGCGLGGGCPQHGTMCAKVCTEDEECELGMFCVDGVCGANFCI